MYEYVPYRDRFYGGTRSVTLSPVTSELLAMDKGYILPFENSYLGRVDFDNYDFEIDARRRVDVTGELLPTQEFYEFMKQLDRNPSKAHTRVKLPALIPVRNNKRKRIQKKWLKRYGVKSSHIYKPIDVRSMKITDNLNGTFTYEIQGYV